MAAKLLLAFALGVLVGVPLGAMWNDLLEHAPSPYHLRRWHYHRGGGSSDGVGATGGGRRATSASRRGGGVPGGGGGPTPAICERSRQLNRMPDCGWRGVSRVHCEGLGCCFVASGENKGPSSPPSSCFAPSGASASAGATSAGAAVAVPLHHLLPSKHSGDGGSASKIDDAGSLQWWDCGFFPGLVNFVLGQYTWDYQVQPLDADGYRPPFSGVLEYLVQKAELFAGFGKPSSMRRRAHDVQAWLEPGRGLSGVVRLNPLPLQVDADAGSGSSSSSSSTTTTSLPLMIRFTHDFVDEPELAIHWPARGTIRVVVVAHNHRDNWLAFLKALVRLDDDDYTLCAAGFQGNTNDISLSGLANLVGTEDAERLSPVLLNLAGATFHKGTAINACLQQASFQSEDIMLLMDVDIPLPQGFLRAVRRHVIVGEQFASFICSSDDDASFGRMATGLVAVAREDLLRVGGMDVEKYSKHGGEDHDLFFRLRQAGLRAARIDVTGELGAGLKHRRHVTSKTFLQGVEAMKEACPRPYSAPLHRIRDYHRRPDW